MPFSTTVASLSNHVGRVIGGSPDEQMLWVHTRRVVTLMQNFHSYWNLCSVQFPRESMRGNSLSLFNEQSPISSDILSARPMPAPSTFNHISPKTDYWFSSSHSDLFLRRRINKRHASIVETRRYLLDRFNFYLEQH